MRQAVPSLRHVLVAGDPGTGTSEADGSTAGFVALDSVAREGDSLPSVDPSDIAVMLVSGGTTGLPKLIARTHDDYVYNATASARVCELGPEDCLPRHPARGPQLSAGLSRHPRHRRDRRRHRSSPLDPSPEAAFAAIEKHGVSVTGVVPPLASAGGARQWIEEEADLSSLRLLQVGGARLAEVNARDVEPALACTLQQVFGMAEGLLNYTRLDDDKDLVCTTQGRPLSPADELRVVDADGNRRRPGEKGELLTRGPYTLRGYYRAPDTIRACSPPTASTAAATRPATTQRPPGRERPDQGCDQPRWRKHPCRGTRGAPARPPRVSATPPRSACPMPHSAKRPVSSWLSPANCPPRSRSRPSSLERGLATYKLPDLIRQADTLPITAVGKIDRRR